MTIKPLIAITMGDPCGIGPEIVVKALASKELNQICTPLVIGDMNAMERARSLLKSPIGFQVVNFPSEANFLNYGTFAIIPLSSLAVSDIQYSKPTVSTGEAFYQYICHGAKLCLAGEVAAMATAPINKEAMNMAGHHYPGHTELLAELCGKTDFVMMLAGDVLRVSLVTIHEALADVPRLITVDKILKTIRITADGVRRLTGKSFPKLAVLSLNPHAGEGGMFGDEEKKVIMPAIAAARSESIDVAGPLSADTLFYFAAKGEYDGVVAMYHDQGLIPLKMLHFDDGVNCTLGLPIIRTSVDHGTAYPLAGTGKASEKSMLAAIKMAVKLATIP